MGDPKFKVVEASSLRVEEGAKELLSAPEMQPYSRYIEAAVFGGDVPLQLDQPTISRPQYPQNRASVEICFPQ